MTNRTVLYGALVASFLQFSTAMAECGRDHQATLEKITAADLKELDGWTVRHSGLKPAKALPSIGYRSAAELAARRYGAAFAHDGKDLIALYDSETRTLLLSNSWSGSDAAARSVIVHEIVHHLQHENGKRFPCPAGQEEQAFAVQEAFLAEHGTTLEKEFGIDPFTRLAASLCLY